MLHKSTQLYWYECNQWKCGNFKELDNSNFDNSLTERSFTIRFLRSFLFKGSDYEDSRINKRI